MGVRRKMKKKVPTLQDMSPWGVRQLFGGARKGQPFVTGLGAAVTILAWLQRRQPPKSERIVRRKLKRGEVIQIRLIEGDTVIGEQTIEG